ncbi:MAG: hypothetical protein KKA90_05110 [Nanoarchaeota archaeon]|nr:hypothetical protein [Nanoarchaeota archaeon]
MKKAQSELMNYVFLTFLLMVAVTMIIIFLIGWQVTQLNFEKSKGITDRALFLLKYTTATPLLVKDVSLFDDRKLAMFAVGGEETCTKLASFVGGGDWFFNVTVFDGKAPVRCAPGEVTNCNQWSFCEQSGRKFTAFALPVNVYRTFAITTPTDFLTQTDLGVVTVGVYT